MEREKILYRKLMLANAVIVMFVIGSILFTVGLFTLSVSMLQPSLIFLWIGLGLAVLYCILLLVFYIVKKVEGDLY